MKIKSITLFILFIAVLFQVAIRIRLIDTPLERDEGEYAYSAQLILEGFPPYSSSYNMKMPGVYYGYSLIFKIFGETVRSIRTGIIFLNSLTIILLFFITKKLSDEISAVISSLAYSMFSVSLWSQSISANAEHFVNFFVLSGIFIFLTGKEKSSYFYLISGLMFGFAFLMKQHSIFFLIGLITYIIIDYLFIKKDIFLKLTYKILLLIAGSLVPFLLICFLLYTKNVFDKFWFWTWTYAKEYVSGENFSEGIKTFKVTFSGIFNSSVPIWLFAGIGLLACFKKIKENLFTVIFFIFSFFSIVPGFYFRQHYYILLFPAISILFPYGINTFLYKLKIKRKKEIFLIILAILSVLYGVYYQRKFFFIADPDTACYMMFGENPFIESPQIAKYIQENTKKYDTIAVLGSEPQIYFYSKRHSATGYIYTYPLVEKHKLALQMQKEMIKEIELKKPEIIVFVNYPMSWLPEEGHEKLIFNWAEDYINKYYEKVSIISTFKPHWTGIFKRIN